MGGAGSGRADARYRANGTGRRRRSGAAQASSAAPSASSPRSSAEARGVVDESQPLERVVRSLARMSALTAGLITGNPELLAAAHGDEIHEAPRAELSPVVASLIEAARRAGALHAARSGAGPSVLALVTSDTETAVRAAFERAGCDVVGGAIESTGLITTLGE